MNLETVLNFFKKDRKKYLIISAFVYILCLLIPQKTIDSSNFIQIIIIICFSSPICFYNFIGWKDTKRELKKRNFSRFCFFFLLFIVVGNVIIYFV